MALQSNFFGNKRESDAPLARSNVSGAASVTMPSGAAAGHPLSATATTATVREPAAASATSAAPDKTEQGNPSKLTVGPRIKLKGVEITDCDTLVVEGLVEATMDSRVMQVEQEGAFKGSAEVDFAEIRGSFEGTLNARTRLVIRATGKVTGHVRYGSVVIEEGGQLGGEVQFGPAAAASAIIATSSPARLERVVAA
ncbi:polymer-forming cytoskeletal protein [Xylophilus rhododendri]|uniref:Polymer-forming cytoskeletal protein n=1 Tax=Xylophilus rhododendri TaxID=2697032 RepID=A0A857J4D4_9BURK|nr:polymer-forming cytoskeletal protein [Xylophilus rhododendri]QHI98814.1 polymer-forming cytoskeletal protein [Xylophilus rhododendri]